jgi:uncharacterized protein
MSVTVRLPDDLAALLAEEAARQSVTADELAARVLAEHIPARRKLGFVALGASNSGGTAAEAEELLAEGFGRWRWSSTPACCSLPTDRSDPDHTACRELLEAHPGPLVTTELVIAETGWLIDRQLGAAAEAALYESAAAGEIRVEPLSAADWTRIAALTVQYADQHLGGVDSSLVAIAERLGATSIGTLDRRHFGLVRPLHIAGFELLP